jgi:hypothetical protein
LEEDEENKYTKVSLRRKGFFVISSS